jgi:hypothetical protein
LSAAVGTTSVPSFCSGSEAHRDEGTCGDAEGGGLTEADGTEDRGGDGAAEDDGSEDRPENWSEAGDAANEGGGDEGGF